MKLIAPHYVKPFVKRQKNDAADAEAIVIAAQRPEMRFVDPKSAEQQSRAVIFRARERFVHQRTELVNALRACLYEYGYVAVPKGLTEERTRSSSIGSETSCITGGNHRSPEPNFASSRWRKQVTSGVRGSVRR